MRNDLGVQAFVVLYINEQLGVFDGLGIIRVQQAVPQVQLLEVGQHIVHGVVHGIVGVHQGSVPVDEDGFGFRMGQLQDAHGALSLPFITYC